MRVCAHVCLCKTLHAVCLCVCERLGSRARCQSVVSLTVCVLFRVCVHTTCAYACFFMAKQCGCCVTWRACPAFAAIVDVRRPIHAGSLGDSRAIKAEAHQRVKTAGAIRNCCRRCVHFSCCWPLHGCNCCCISALHVILHFANQWLENPQLNCGLVIVSSSSGLRSVACPLHCRQN